MDMIARNNVSTVAEGMCASAATFMLLAGKERAMTAHSILLIHEVSSVVGWSKHTELKTEMKNSELLMNMILSIYQDKTHLTKKEICKMLKHDKYIDAKTAKELGLIDSTS